MPALLSGSSLRAGSLNTFITLATAQPQLPATPTTSTGYTLITDVVYPSELVTRYASSLGNIEFTTGTMQTNLENLNISIVGNGTGTVIVSGLVANTNSDTGVLVVKGGVGISEGIHTGKDIVVNKLTMGQGYSNISGGVNNIVITGTGEPTLNDFPVGQRSIVIGYDALKGIDTSYKVIAIGNNAVSNGKLLENTIAIGDNALNNIGSTQTEFAANITSIITANPLTLNISTTNFLTTGTEILIRNVLGMTEINDQIYFVDIVSPTSIVLYSDVNLQNSIDASAYNGYTGGTGNIYKTLLWNGNFAIGNNAGKNLINGEQNFFLGYNPAVNFTTGSYNFFMGHEIAGNMTSGNANISIGGDNMVDGLDDQINIGSVFYYNGSGYLELNADTGLGLGTESTSTISGAFNVDGGAGITGNLYVGGILNVVNTTPATTTTDGALVVTGGVGIGGDVWIGGTLHATALSSLVSGSSDRADEVKANPTGSDEYLLAMTSGQSGYTSIYSPSTILYDGLNNVLVVGSYLVVDNPVPSLSTGSGALVVTGGVGIGGELNVNNGVIVYAGDVGIGSRAPTLEYGSIQLNGHSRIEYASDPALEFGTDPFTIEFWIYRTTTAVSSMIMTKDDVGYFPFTGWYIDWVGDQSTGGSAGLIVFAHWFQSTLTSNTPIAPSTWAHVAVVREGTGANQTKLYINGVLDATGTIPGDFNDINALKLNWTLDVADSVYVSNVRIFKNTAFYTGSFTPQFPLNYAAGASLYLKTSNSTDYLLDSSANNFVGTVIGSPPPTFALFTPTVTSSNLKFALHINQTSGNLEFHPNTYDANVGPSSAILSLANDGSASTTVNPLTISNITSATSTVTGALQVVGGVGVKGSVYSKDGNPLQNYLLYTPKVTITDTGLPPPNPKPGDFWIDTQILAELQYVQDGANSFWLQITTL